MKLKKDPTIPHCRILSEIGKGGMGELYLAKDPKLNRTIASKFSIVSRSAHVESLLKLPNPEMYV